MDSAANPRPTTTALMVTKVRHRVGGLRRERPCAALETATRSPLSISWRRRAPASVRLCRATSSTAMRWRWKAYCRTLEYAAKSSMRVPDRWSRFMSAVSARVAVVSGRNAIGIELPNPTREKVYLRELLNGMDYNESAAKLPLCL